MMRVVKCLKLLQVVSKHISASGVLGSIDGVLMFEDGFVS